MTTIRLTEFKGYTREMVHQYLQQSWPCFYTIVLPKPGSLEQGRDEIFTDLLMAHHLSHTLRQHSSEILCSLPDPAEAGSFEFVVLTEDLQKLAETIAFYGNGYEDSMPNEELYDHVMMDIAYTDLETLAIPHYLQASENILMEGSPVDMTLYFN